MVPGEEVGRLRREEEHDTESGESDEKSPGALERVLARQNRGVFVLALVRASRGGEPVVDGPASRGRVPGVRAHLVIAVRLVRWH